MGINIICVDLATSRWSAQRMLRYVVHIFPGTRERDSPEWLVFIALSMRLHAVGAHFTSLYKMSALDFQVCSFSGMEFRFHFLLQAYIYTLYSCFFDHMLMGKMNQ